MVHYRRQDPTVRRRRIVTQRSAGALGGDSSSTRSTDARRRRDSLGAARRSGRTYGSAVRRRLRGRWFQLVPVHKAQLAIAVSIPAVVALCLIAAGYAAIGWAPLATHPEVARPFRMDLPGNLADWVGSQFLLLGAGCSFLIYQMRRYRADDFQGHYRLWRPIILLFLVAALDAVVRVRNALGGLIDLLQGDRILMAGADVVRLAMLIGGAALAIPLIREMRRVPIANTLVVVAFCCLAVPTLLRLGFAAELDPTDATLLTGSARMAGRTLLLVAAIVYLRKVFREVRGLDVDDPVRAQHGARQQRKKAALQVVGEIDEDDEEYLATSGIPIDPRQWFGRKRRDEDEAAADAESDEDESTPPKRRRLRGWLPLVGRSRRKQDDEQFEDDAALEEEDRALEEDEGHEDAWDDEDSEEDAESTADSEADENGAPRRRLKMPHISLPRPQIPRIRLPKPRLPKLRVPRPRLPKIKLPRPRLPRLRMPLPADASEADHGATAARSAAGDGQQEGRATGAEQGGSKLAKLRALRLWRRKPSQPRSSEPTSAPRQSKHAVGAPKQASADEQHPDEVDDGSDVDWSKLSKSERRRLRKTLRRQQNAA